MQPCWEVAASLAQYVERATRRRAPTAKARDKHSGINTIPTRAVTIPRCSLLRRAGSFQHRNCLECALSDSLCVAVGPPKLVCLLPTCLSRPGRRRPVAARRATMRPRPLPYTGGPGATRPGRRPVGLNASTSPGCRAAMRQRAPAAGYKVRRATRHLRPPPSGPRFADEIWPPPPGGPQCANLPRLQPPHSSGRRDPALMHRRAG